MGFLSIPPSHVLFLYIQIHPDALTHIDLNEYVYIYLQECTQVCSVTVFMTIGFKVINCWNLWFQLQSKPTLTMIKSYSHLILSHSQSSVYNIYGIMNMHVSFLLTMLFFPFNFPSLYTFAALKIISSWIILIASVQLTGYQGMCHVFWR